MRMAIISFTEQGGKLGDTIGKDFVADTYKNAKDIISLTEKLMEKYDALVFIGAAGIAVRAVSPYIRSKDRDPAVIVCDERGRFVIPLLSGHIGGANAIAADISRKINAIPVITTATDINGIWAVDSWAAQNGYHIDNIENIKYISSALLRGEKVGLDSAFSIKGQLPENVCFGDFENGIVISPFLKKPFKNTLNIVPKCLCIGIGCRKKTAIDRLWELFDKSGISPHAVRQIATIDIKKDEPVVYEFAEKLGVPLCFYSAKELSGASGDFDESDFVRRVTGVGSVCERASVMNGGKLVLKKISGDGVTMAAAMDDREIIF